MEKYDRILKIKVKEDLIIDRLSRLFGLCIKHKSCKYSNLPKLKEAINIVRNTKIKFMDK